MATHIAAEHDISPGLLMLLQCNANGIVRKLKNSRGSAYLSCSSNIVLNYFQVDTHLISMSKPTRTTLESMHHLSISSALLFISRKEATQVRQELVTRSMLLFEPCRQVALDMICNVYVTILPQYVPKKKQKP
jgi:hypothetical protein